MSKKDEALKLRIQTAIETEQTLTRENQALQRELSAALERLAKAEEYVEQGRAMLGAVMERWYHYE